MIPKTIHYCWFGRGEKPRLVKTCIESWKRYCPDYNIVEWNEDNIDINMNAYTHMCYEEHMWAFLSDYVRLYVVAEHGGIYFDTDVEVIRSFDSLLSYQAFFGFENSDAVATGLGFGAEAHHPIVEQMIKEYDKLMDGKHGVEVCTKLNTSAIRKFGFSIDGKYQERNGVLLLPEEYLNPMNSATGEISRTNSTYSIHRYAMSSYTKAERMKSRITRVFHRYFGVDCFEFLKRNRG